MITIKQGDTHNAIRAQLTKNNNPINLTGCKVLITVSSIVFEDECMINDEEAGTVTYPVYNISSKNGIYFYEFIVIYNDGTREIVPNDGKEKIYILEHIKE